MSMATQIGRPNHGSTTRGADNTRPPGPRWGASGTRSFSHRLSAIVARHRPGHRILAVRRVPLPSRGRRSVERLSIALDGGGGLEVVFKDLGAPSGTGHARVMGTRRVWDPGREPWAYRTLLGPAGLDVPACLGAISDRIRNRHWLFLEPVEGETLETSTDPAHWVAAARWLARFQLEMSGRPAFGGPMLRHDPSLHHWWWRRAMARARQSVQGALDRGRTAALEALDALRGVAGAHEKAALDVLRQRPSVVHGDFGASNVLVQAGDEPRVRPVDWEMVGLGPRLYDLAALVADAPGDEIAQETLDAYRSEAALTGASAPDDRDLERELSVCGLLRAVERCGRGDLDQAHVAAALAEQVARA